jgi:prephenate dehydrogenase
MKLLVVGAGTMGRWFAASVASAGDEVGFADTDPDAAREAVEDVGGRVVDPDGEESFDVVCVAVPMPAAPDAIERYAARARQAVCDVTGSMRDPIAAMRDSASERERMSLHPLFAPERAPGNVAVVTDEGGEVTERIQQRLTDAGNDVVETTPEEHDDAMETVQARAHTAVLAFALAAESVPDHFQTPVSAGLFDLVEQMTGGEARVYADVQSAFDGAEDVAAAASELADADTERFLELYEDLS